MVEFKEIDPGTAAHEMKIEALRCLYYNASPTQAEQVAANADKAAAIVAAVISVAKATAIRRLESGRQFVELDLSDNALRYDLEREARRGISRVVRNVFSGTRNLDNVIMDTGEAVSRALEEGESYVDIARAIAKAPLYGVFAPAYSVLCDKRDSANTHRGEQK